ncbi:hypothetical protein N9M16_02765 [Candidatus Dependentiae bacterium]|nr:hypothetical protein [Candidatus Dependentiae bacterium]
MGAIDDIAGIVFVRILARGCVVWRLGEDQGESRADRLLVFSRLQRDNPVGQ